jgi:L-fuculose-phosphate aldolase
LANETQLRADIVEIGKFAWQKGWVAANDGNISVRLDDRRILCTPTGVSKGMMHADDLIVCDMDGNKVDGKRERTSEIMMHCTVYQMRPDIASVVHFHPPHSTGFAVAGRALNEAILPEVILLLGCVPLAEYGLPGTPALSDTLKPYIPGYDAILMGNHGVVCYASDLWKAYFRMETVEHTARIALVAEMLGGAKVLPRLEVAKLFDSRSRYGIVSRTSVQQGCPVAAEDLSGAVAGVEERFEFTRAELIALINEALAARGVTP